jgi:hypothetical protein
VVLAVGGAEALTDEAVAWSRAAAISRAVVGGVPDHHLAQRAIRAEAAAYFALPGDLPLFRTGCPPRRGASGWPLATSR